MRHANTHMYPLNKAKHVTVVHQAMMMVHVGLAHGAPMCLYNMHILCVLMREKSDRT